MAAFLRKKRGKKGKGRFSWQFAFGSVRPAVQKEGIVRVRQTVLSKGEGRPALTRQKEEISWKGKGPAREDSSR